MEIKAIYYASPKLNGGITHTLDVEIRFQILTNSAVRATGNDEFFPLCYHLTSCISISNFNCNLQATVLNNEE